MSQAQAWTVVHNVTLIASGVFLWDYSTTLWLELRVATGRVSLGWALIPYFLTRYTSLGFVIACLLFQTSQWRLSCDAVYVSGNLLGKIAVASASVNLVVRTVVVWSYRWYIILSLGALITGQVILIGIGLRERSFFASWSNDLQHCIGSHAPRTSDLGIFAPYAASVDCIIVILTAIGLRKFYPTTGFAAVLFRQGLYFFVLVLSFQTFVAVTVFTQDSGILVSISSVLCAIIVPMVSCQLVRSILGDPRRLDTASHGNSAIGGEGLRPADRIQLTTCVDLESCTSSR